MHFSMSNYAVNAAAGLAVITVVRDGGGGVVTVAYAAGGGTATPGTDYTPVSGTLTFGLGITVQNFTIPIIDDLQLQTDKTVNLAISTPTGGATLGVPSAAILTIQPDRRDHTPPTVQGIRLITNRHHIVTGLVVTFSKPLNPSTATNLLNYGYSVRTAGRNHRFGARDNLLIPIKRALYNASDLTVTLTLGRGIHPPTPFQLRDQRVDRRPGRRSRCLGSGWQPPERESEQRAGQPVCGHSQWESGWDHPPGAASCVCPTGQRAIGCRGGCRARDRRALRPEVARVPRIATATASSTAVERAPDEISNRRSSFHATSDTRG